MAPPMALASASSALHVYSPTASASTTIFSETTTFPTPQRNGTGQPSHRQQKKTLLIMVPFTVLSVLGIAGVETIDQFNQHAHSGSTAGTAKNETSGLHPSNVPGMPASKPIETPAAGDFVNTWIRNVTSDHLHQTTGSMTSAQSAHGKDGQVDATDRELQRRAPPITKETKRLIKMYLFPTFGYLVGAISGGWMIDNKIEGEHHMSDRGTGPTANGTQPRVAAQQSDVRIEPRTTFDNRVLHGITKWGKDIGEWTKSRMKPSGKRIAKTTYTTAGYGGLGLGFVAAPIIYEKGAPHHHKPKDQHGNKANATSTPSAQPSEAHDNPPSDKLQARSAPPTPRTPLNIAGVFGFIGVGAGATLGLAFGLSHTKSAKDAIARGKKKHADKANDKLEQIERKKWRKEHPISNKRDITVAEGEMDLLPVLFDLGYLSSTDEHKAPAGILSVGMGEDGYLDIFAEETGIHFNGTISKIHHTTDNGIAVGNLTVSLPGENKTGHWYSVDPKEVGPESINAFAEMFANRTQDSTDDFDVTVDVDVMTRHFSPLFDH